MRLPPNDDSADDLTAIARIRNSAIALFATDGFERASLRAIAAAAGVTAGLVNHHFGSKAELRTTCDEYVLRVLVRRARSDGTTTGMQDVAHDFFADPGGYALYVRYMARAVEEDTPAAARFVATMVDESEAVFRAGAADGSMRASADPRALAVFSVLTTLTMLTMPPAFTRELGFPGFGADVMRRMALPTLELYTHGLYTDETALRTLRDAAAAEED
ncbi:TetR family transcriptional regulator [Humibacter antri]